MSCHDAAPVPQFSLVTALTYQACPGKQPVPVLSVACHPHRM
ncbi:hypothetical protein SACS_1803 [Parasaccharibacter apium]|uniref:Uncharacterized protein n=1 Tax=Parasaccharibacter apium TaxID=1510841 RepID=A0A7U7G3U6_9PROT|nr:hypothetical protein SACS_1803 [Parasaccharibacter apium]